MPLLKPLTRLFNDEKSKTPRCIQVTVSLQLLFHHLFAPHTTSGQLGNFERMVCYLVCLCSFQQGYIWSSLLRNSTLSTIIKCRQEGEFSSVSAGHYLRNRSIIRRMSFVTSSRFLPLLPRPSVSPQRNLCQRGRSWTDGICDWPSGVSQQVTNKAGFAGECVAQKGDAIDGSPAVAVI